MSQVTKRALEQSLKNLLLKKPLSKITISDLTEDCGMNRMTFYYHFKDIYDLVEWACLTDAKALIYQMAGGAAGGIVMFLLGGKVTLFSDVGFPFLNFLRFGEFALGGAAGMVVAFAVSLALGLVFGFSTVEEN